MKYRLLAVGLAVCGSVSIAGCPLGLGYGLGGGYGAIGDGTYSGTSSAEVAFWESGVLADRGSDGGYTDATFLNGALLKDSGGAFRIGDVDVLADGEYRITREVYDVESGPWGYEITFDLTAEWNSIPMSGWEIATYTANADGTIDLFDEIELTSEDWFDGGAWTIHSDAYATLSRGLASPPAPAPAPSGSPRDILDLKSGKALH